MCLYNGYCGRLQPPYLLFLHIIFFLYLIQAWPQVGGLQTGGAAHPAAAADRQEVHSAAKWHCQRVYGPVSRSLSIQPSCDAINIYLGIPTYTLYPSAVSSWCATKRTSCQPISCTSSTNGPWNVSCCQFRFTYAIMTLCWPIALKYWRRN